MNNTIKDIKRLTIYKILLEFIITKNQLKPIINKHINQLSLNEKNYIFETCNGTIENFILITSLISKYSKFKNSNQTISILSFSIYNILFSKNIPNYAIINSAVELAKQLRLKNYNFINAILRKITTLNEYDFFNGNIKNSYQKWLYEKLSNQLGKNNLKIIIKWNNSNRDIYIRQVNKSKFSEVCLFLNDNNIQYSIFNDYIDYIKLNKINSDIASYLTKNALGYIQSPSSGFVTKLLDPQPDDIIIDACSAPGGKSIHISNLLNNSGTIYSYDIDKNRYQLLLENIKQYGIKNIKTFNLSFKDCHLKNINKILLDVPCTGTGVINRKPYIKIRRTKKDLFRFSKLQMSLLNYASKIISKYGVIIYSTCSILKEENWDIVDNFLKNNPDFKVCNAKKYIMNKYVDPRGALVILPHIHNLDGMFAIRLIKYK